MKKIFILLSITILSACSYAQINGYNLEVKDNIYKEYLINETIIFLKQVTPPARHKIIFIGVKNNNYEELFLNRLRTAGYSINEKTSEEAIDYKIKDSEFKLSYSIDYVFKKDKKEIDKFYISLQLFINDSVYSKIYSSEEINDLPKSLGSWSHKQGGGKL